MSASRALTDSCPRCGGDLPPAARFCPGCGLPLDEPAGRTTLVQLPPEETGPVPVTLQRAEPRWFGAAPPALLLAVTVLVLVAAIALFAAGRWPYGLILAGVGALLLAAFLEAGRRRPHGHTRARRGSGLGERTRSAWEAWRARSAAVEHARRIESGLLVLEAERRRALQELGAAAHRRDALAEAEARAALEELDARESALRAELEQRLTAAGERIRRATLPVQETVMVLPSEPNPGPSPAQPPEPAVVPEPYPPPDEGNPPEPARIPEPTPDQPRRED